MTAPRAIISVGVDGAAASRREIETIGDAMRRMNEISLQRLGGQVGAINERITGLQSTIGNVTSYAIAGLSLAGFVGQVNKALDSLGQLDDLSQKIGTSVESLSRLQKVAKAFGVDFGAVDSVLTKFARGLTGTDDEASKVQKALKALGIEAKDSSGQLRDPVELFIDMSKQLQNYQDGAGKAALATDALGKSGADLLPFMNDVADNIDRFSAVSTKAATDAAEMQDKLGLLRVRSDELATVVGLAALPAVNDLAGAILDVAGAQGELADANLQAFFDDLAVGAARVADVLILLPKIASAVSGSFKVVAADIEFLKVAAENSNPIKAAWKLANGGNPIADIQRAADERNSVLVEANRKWDDLWNRPANQLEQAMLKRIAARGTDAPSPQSAADPKKLLAYKTGNDAAADDAERAAAAYKNLTSAIRAKIAQSEIERDTGVAASVVQQEQIKLDEEVAAGKLKLTPVQREQVDAMLRELKVNLEVIASKKRAAEGQEGYEKIRKEYLESTAKAIEEATKEADRNEELARTFGLTKAAIEEVELARLEERLAQRSSLGLTLDEIEHLEQLIAVKKRSRDALRTIDQGEAAKKAQEDWRRAAESIEQSLTDALLRGFESGKSLGENLIDTLKNMFSSLVLRPVISAVVNPVASALTGVLGMAGTAQAASEGGGAVSNATGIIGGLSALSGSFGTGLMSGLSAWGAEGSVMGLLNSGALFGGGIANGLGAIAGALGPIALGLGAAVAIWKKLDTSGTYHTGGASRATADGVSTIRAESLNFEPTRTSAETEKLTAGLASGIVSILDSTALAFGKTAGYSAATAFADDSSKDGAWGALVISKMGDKLIDWQDTRTSKWAPKEFADGEAGQQQYLAALSASVRGALDGIGLPGWAKSMLESLGEGAGIEEMAKVVDSINQTQGALKLMGAQLVGFSSLSDAAVSALMKAAGGIEALASNASVYFDNFYSEAEKSTALQSQMADALKAVNLAVPSTRDEYRALLESQLALGEAGAATVAVLFKNAGAFAQLHPLVEAVTGAVENQAEAARQAAKEVGAALLGSVGDAFSALQRVVDRERDQLEAHVEVQTATVNRLKSLSGVLHSTLDSMRAGEQTLSDRAQAQAQIRASLVIARAGGKVDADSIQKALAVVSQDASSMFATQQDYLRDFYATQNDIAALAGVTDQSLTVEERSLAQLEKQLTSLDAIVANGQAQIDALKGLDVSQLTIAQAIAALASTVGAAQANPVASSGGSIAKLYHDIFGRAPDAAGLAYWQERLAGGISLDAIRETFLGSAESKKLRGFDVGTNRVPYDMPAMIHEDERIIPAADNRELMRRLSSPAESNVVLAAAVDRLTAENVSMRRDLNDALYAIAKNTMETKDTLDKWDYSGQPKTRSDEVQS